MTAEHAELHCERCEQVTEHELHYAGRLLESVRCRSCGRTIGVSGRVLLPAYVADLEQRVVSKPGRMLRRLSRDPVGFLLGFPGAVLRQPGKFVLELRELVRRPPP